MTRPSLIDRRHHSPVRCGWLLPCVALVLAGAVELNVAAQARELPRNSQVELPPSNSRPASAAPYKRNVAAIQTSTVESSTSVTDAQRMPGSAAAPLWGVDGKGVAYVIERNPPWPLTEFKIIFTNERR